MWIVWFNVCYVVSVGLVMFVWLLFEFVVGWVGLSVYMVVFVVEECEVGLCGVWCV